MTDKNDGTYHVSWKYNRQGSHQISVSLERDQKGSLCGDLDGDGLIDEVCHAEFSPTTSRVLRVSADALQPPNPGSSYAYGAALFAAEAGVPSTIYVQSRKLRVSTQTFDEFNRSSITGGADVKARALLVLENDPDNVTVASGFDFFVFYKKEAAYEIVYNARVVGTYYLEATLNSLLDHEVGTHFVRAANERRWGTHRQQFGGKLNRRRDGSKAYNGHRILSERDALATEEGLATLNTLLYSSGKVMWSAALS